MLFLFWLIVIIAIAMIGGIIYIVYLSKYKEEQIDATFLYNIIKFAFTFFFLIYLISIILSLIGINLSEAMLILFAKTMIYLVYFTYIFINTQKLLMNLKDDKIFVKENYFYTKKIGQIFLYLALTESLSGLFLDILDVLNGGNFAFNVTTNFTIFIFVIIGLVLFLISKILQKSIEIYQENELTI